MAQEVSIRADRGVTVAQVDGRQVPLGVAVDAALEITRARLKHALATGGRFHLAMPQEEPAETAASTAATKEKK